MSGVKCLPAIAALAALIISMSVLPDESFPKSASVMSAQWTDHGMIVITSNSMFTTENGVVSGSGTKSDPYIIEGWKIGPLVNRTGILIQGTTAHFRVRDVYVFSCSMGVFMHTVHNGRVENSQFVNDEIGVAAYESDDCKVTESVFEGCTIAISISYSDVSQSDNTFINNADNVLRFKDKAPPWEQTWVGATVCMAILVPLAAMIVILVYFRMRRPLPPSP